MLSVDQSGACIVWDARNGEQIMQLLQPTGALGCLWAEEGRRGQHAVCSLATALALAGNKACMEQELGSVAGWVDTLAELGWLEGAAQMPWALGHAGCPVSRAARLLKLS